MAPSRGRGQKCGLEDVQILVIHRDMVEEHAKGEDRLVGIL